MSHNYQIKLNIVNSQKILFATKVLLSLAILSATINSQVLLAVVLLGVFLKIEWIASVLGIVKVSDHDLILIIFPGGKVRLESNENIIEGDLGPQQWCSLHAAIIQVVIGGRKQNFLVVSALQEVQEDFRRFNMWIRQEFSRDVHDLQAFDK